MMSEMLEMMRIATRQTDRIIISLELKSFALEI
jgi:hypothetical protein